jgi:hypothetical protein
MPDSFPVSRLFKCSGEKPVLEGPLSKEFNDLVAGQHTIVLLGGTFGGQDLHETPLGEKTPGILVNALAVKAALAPADADENRVLKFIYRGQRPYLPLLDLAMGFSIIGISFWFERHWPQPRNLNKVLQLSLLYSSIPLVVACLFYGVFAPSLLPNLIGVGLSVLLQQYIEVWFIAFKDEKHSHRGH